MAIAQAVTCDVCGKVKGEVNHWWLLFIQHDGFFLHSWGKADEKLAHQHICGQECVIKALNKWMQEQAT